MTVQTRTNDVYSPFSQPLQPLYIITVPSLFSLTSWQFPLIHIYVPLRLHVPSSQTLSLKSPPSSSHPTPQYIPLLPSVSPLPYLTPYSPPQHPSTRIHCSFFLSNSGSKDDLITNLIEDEHVNYTWSQSDSPSSSSHPTPLLLSVGLHPPTSHPTPLSISASPHPLTCSPHSPNNPPTYCESSYTCIPVSEAG